MISAFPCPLCHGQGTINSRTCGECAGIGYLGQDETYQYYLEKLKSGDYKAAGIKPAKASTPLLFKLLVSIGDKISTIFQEPNDFLSAVKECNLARK